MTNNIGAWYDLHNHTRFSHDSKAAPEEMLQVAKERGLAGIGFTEHAGMNVGGYLDAYDDIKGAFPYNDELRRISEGMPELLIGIELAAMTRCPAYAREVMDRYDYDMIFGSVHSVKTKDGFFHFSRTAPATRKEAAYLFEAYFEECLATLDIGGFQIFPHLNYPLRYLNDKHGFDLDFTAYIPRYEEIFRDMIKKNVCLELNTLNGENSPARFCPDEVLLALYYHMGGRLISLGSDTHACEHIGRGLSGSVQMLKKIGFTKACFFRRKKCFTYSL